MLSNTHFVITHGFQSPPSAGMFLGRLMILWFITNMLFLILLTFGTTGALSVHPKRVTTVYIGGFAMSYILLAFLAGLLALNSTILLRLCEVLHESDRRKDLVFKIIQYPHGLMVIYILVMVGICIKAFNGVLLPLDLGFPFYLLLIMSLVLFFISCKMSLGLMRALRPVNITSEG